MSLFGLVVSAGSSPFDNDILESAVLALFAPLPPFEAATGAAGSVVVVIDEEEVAVPGGVVAAGNGNVIVALTVIGLGTDASKANVLCGSSI